MSLAKFLHSLQRPGLNWLCLWRFRGKSDLRQFWGVSGTGTSQYYPHAGTFLQVYYPNKKIDVGYGEHIMAYEFLEFKPLGRTRKFTE